MKISNKLIKQLSSLARLEFKDEDFSAIKSDLKKILNFIEIIEKLDVEKEEPLTHISSELNVLRDDIIVNYECKQSAMMNSPEIDSDYFKVKKVIIKN